MFMLTLHRHRSLLMITTLLVALVPLLVTIVTKLTAKCQKTEMWADQRAFFKLVERNMLGAKYTSWSTYLR